MHDEPIKDNVILFLSDARGIYIPRDFVQQIFLNDWDNLSLESVAICNEGPENPGYWDAWVDILDNATLVDPTGKRFHLYQDGDLWLMAYDHMTPEERANFGFDNDE